MIFFCKISFKSLINRKEPEPEPELETQFMIPAPGGNSISDPRLSAPKHWLFLGCQIHIFEGNQFIVSLLSGHFLFIFPLV